MHAIASNGRDARAFGTAKIAVIGPGTARHLGTWGIVPDLVADEHEAEALARQLLAFGPAHSALLVRAEVAREVLPSTLREAGVDVDVVTAYKTRRLTEQQRDTLVNMLQSSSVDAVLLTSSSMAQALAESLGHDAPNILAQVCVASIGPVTSSTLNKHGIQVTVSASKYTIEGLLEALESHYLSQDTGPGGAQHNAC